MKPCSGCKKPPDDRRWFDEFTEESLCIICVRREDSKTALRDALLESPHVLAVDEVDRIIETIDRYRPYRDIDDALHTLMMTYRKHKLGDDSIGWEELGDLICDTICNIIGDDSFCEWIKDRAVQ